MTPYLILFISFLSAYVGLELITSGHRRSTRATRLILVLPLVVFAVTYAGSIGTDTDNYGRLYGMAEDFPVEPGFSMLMMGAKSIGLDYVDFTKVLALVQMMLLALIVVRLRDPLFFLLFYLSSFFFNFQFNAIRNSLALLIIAALYVRMQRLGVLTLLASSVIHYSSLITLGFQRLAISRRPFMAISAILLIAGVFVIVWLRPDFAGDYFGDMFVYQGYLLREYEEKSVYPALLLKLAVVWIFFRNGGNRFYLFTYLILVLLVHLISPILSRLCDLVLFLALLDVCTQQRLIRYRLVAIGLALILMLSSLLIPWNDCQNGGVDNWCLSR
jgi:hypothetical protein